MVTNIKVLFTDPAIIEVEFEPLDDFIIDSVYKDKNFEQLSFENLVVYSGRKEYITENSDRNFTILKEYFYSTYKPITKALCDIDKIRYPVFYDFDKWWEKNNFDHKSAFLVIKDMKNFSQPWHLDNRFSMWAGVVNLADNKTSTIFSKTNHDWTDLGKDTNRRYYKASGKKWTGTFWLNTENNWHGVPCVSEKERRVIVFNMLLAT